MANWDALMGLGQGLMEVGGGMFKSQLAEKLKIAEEDRAAKRATDKRTTEIVGQKLIQRDGVWFEQDVNAAGNALNERLAPQHEVERLNREKLQEDTSLQAAILGNRNLERTGQLTDRKLADYASDRELDREVQQANIDQSRAAARRSDRPDSIEATLTAPPTPLEAARMVSKEFSELTTQARGLGISQGEIDQMAENVVNAAATPDEARKRFRDSLGILVRNKLQERKDEKAGD